MSGARDRLGHGAGEPHRHLLQRTRAAARLACGQQRGFVPAAASPYLPRSPSSRGSLPRPPAHQSALAARNCARLILPDKESATSPRASAGRAARKPGHGERANKSGAQSRRAA